MAKERLALGLDLGGTNINTVLLREDGTVLAVDHRETMAHLGLEAALERMVASIERTTRALEIGFGAVAGVGIGAPGPLDPCTGIVFFAPNLPGWRDVPLKALMAEKLGLPVFVDNDANLAALGEHRYGAGKGFSNVIYVTISTGIGGGMIIDGKLYRGASGCAGEIGHMTIDPDGPRCNCGNVGCWEALASGTSLARDAKESLAGGVPSLIRELAKGRVEEITALTVYQAAQGGDTLALKLIAQCAQYLGLGLVNLIHIFNPELIVIGGGLAQMGPLFLEPAERLVREKAFELPAQAVSIRPAQLGEDSGAIGAAVLALEGV